MCELNSKLLLVSSIHILVNLLYKKHYLFESYNALFCSGSGWQMISPTDLGEK